MKHKKGFEFMSIINVLSPSYPIHHPFLFTTQLYMTKNTETRFFIHQYKLNRILTLINRKARIFLNGPFPKQGDLL